jgi:hypothetical protein
MSDPLLRPDQPAFWSDFAALVAGGGLRGDAAEDAIVDFITASEVGPRDPPRLRVEVRELVEEVVRGDADLRALLHAEVSGPAPIDPAPALDPAPLPAPRAEAIAAPRREPRREAPSAPRRSGPVAARRARRRPQGDRVEADDVEGFAARQTRRRILTALAIVGGVVLGGWLWSVLREKPCDRLARKICLALDDCETSVVRAALRTRKIGEETCDATRTAIDEAIAGVDPAKSVPIFTRVMREQIGFDPRGEKVAAGGSEGAASKRAEAMTVVEGVSTLVDLFADDAHLIWTRQDPPGVFRARNIGGSIEVLAEHPDAVDVVATRDFVYWVSRDPAGGKLWTDKKRGEHEPMLIEVEGFAPVRAAFMGPELAFADGTTGAIVMAAVAGGEPRRIAEGGLPAPVEITADATDVFWATTDGALFTAPRSGGQTRVLAERQHAPASLATDPTHLYWIDRGQGRLVRVPKAGGAIEILVDDRPGLWDLTLDDARVITTDRDAGMVLAVPKSGGAITVLAEGLSQPTRVVVDGAAVYWEAGGVLQRLPK